MEEITHAIPWKYDLHNVSAALAADYFLSKYETVWDWFWTTLNTNIDLHKDFKVVFTGHSLGGALTVHAAIDSMLNGLEPSKIKVYTFGQPRIGNKYLEEKLTQNVKECYRIVHNADIVS